MNLCNSGGGVARIKNINFHTAGTFDWEVPEDGSYTVYLCGGGGGAKRSNHSGRGGMGGGGSGFSIKEYILTKGQIIPIVVGAGGYLADGGQSSFDGSFTVEGGLYSTSSTSGGDGVNGGSNGGAYNAAATQYKAGFVQVGVGGALTEMKSIFEAHTGNDLIGSCGGSGGVPDFEGVIRGDGFFLSGGQQQPTSGHAGNDGINGGGGGGTYGQIGTEGKGGDGRCTIRYCVPS